MMHLRYDNAKMAAFVLMSSSLDESEHSEQQLPPGYYGVGDDAFVNSNVAPSLNRCKYK
jgi:hypothetical protein